MLWWPIYMIMNSSSFINTNPSHSQRDFLPEFEPDTFRTDTSTCYTNTLILYICSFHVFFLAPNRPQQLAETPFSNQSIVMSPFMSHMTFRITFFTDCCTHNFFFTGESMYFHFIGCLFDSFVNILTKTVLSVHSSYSSVNFTWFALISFPKFGERPLFKPGAISFICHHFE